MFRPIDRSLHTTGRTSLNYFVSGDFYASGMQQAEATKSLVEVVGRGGCNYPSLDIGQGFQYYKAAIGDKIS